MLVFPKAPGISTFFHDFSKIIANHVATASACVRTLMWISFGEFQAIRREKTLTFLLCSSSFLFKTQLNLKLKRKYKSLTFFSRVMSCDILQVKQLKTAFLICLLSYVEYYLDNLFSVENSSSQSQKSVFSPSAHTDDQGINRHRKWGLRYWQPSVVFFYSSGKWKQTFTPARKLNYISGDCLIAAAHRSRALR